jgi:hypothetical protein
MGTNTVWPDVIVVASTDPHVIRRTQGVMAEALTEARAVSLLPAYLDRLPVAHRWTTRERARWLRAFIAALDLEIETTDELQNRDQEGQA